MDNRDYFDEMTKPKRSTMLTVLCILTFMGSAGNIMSNTLSLVMFQNGVMEKVQQNQAKTMERIKESKSEKNNFALKIMENSQAMMDPEKMKQSALMQIIAAVLTLTGGILMFRQKITGYGIYIVGCLLAIGSVLYIYGGNNFMTKISAGVSGLFSLIFIILYGMCLKEMRSQKVIA